MSIPEPTPEEKVYTLLSIHPKGLSLAQLDKKLDRIGIHKIEAIMSYYLSTGIVACTNKLFWLRPQTIRQSKAAG